MKKLNITYRKATLADITLVADIYLKFSHKVHEIEQTELDDKTIEHYLPIARECLETPLITTMLAFDGDTVVGFADWYEIPVKKFLFLDDLFVIDSYAGNGIGSELMLLFEAEATAKKFGMKLEVYAYNTHARDIYKHRGYSEDGVVMVKTIQ